MEYIHWCLQLFACTCEWKKNATWSVIRITIEVPQFTKVTSEETEHKSGFLWRELARKAKWDFSWPLPLLKGTLQKKVRNVNDLKDICWKSQSWEGRIRAIGKVFVASSWWFLQAEKSESRVLGAVGAAVIEQWGFPRAGIGGVGGEGFTEVKE